MKKLITYALVFVFLYLTAVDLSGQRRKKRTSKREKSESHVPIAQKLNLDIAFGNIGFFGSSQNSQFNLALKPGLNYKVSNRFAIGPYIKMDYLFVNTNTQDFNLIDYGAGIAAKFKIVESVYLRGEYGLTSYSFDRSSFVGVVERRNFSTPMVGLGYRNGNGFWKVGAEIMFHTNNSARDYANNIFEYWIIASRNF